MRSPQSRGFECPQCASQDISWDRVLEADPLGVCRNCGMEFHATEAVYDQQAYWAAVEGEPSAPRCLLQHFAE